jgi:hypothetical protein
MALGRLDVLAVGGVFGSVGYLLHWGFVATGAAAWTDAIAASVVISNLAARVIFGRTGPMGTVPPLGRRFRPDATANWLPWHQEWRDVVFIGATVGLFAAFICARSGLGPGKESVAFISTGQIGPFKTGRQAGFSGGGDGCLHFSAGHTALVMLGHTLLAALQGMSVLLQQDHLQTGIQCTNDNACAHRAGTDDGNGGH